MRLARRSSSRCCLFLALWFMTFTCKDSHEGHVETQESFFQKKNARELSVAWLRLMDIKLGASGALLVGTK
jgi:hypothetical protein